MRPLQSKFGGYKIYPVYQERVNNYMLNVQHDPTKVPFTDEELEETKAEMQSQQQQQQGGYQQGAYSHQGGYQQQANTQQQVMVQSAFGRQVPNNNNRQQQNFSTSLSQGFSQEEQVEEPVAQTKRRVTAADLRNKRAAAQAQSTARANNVNGGGNRMMTGRTTPSYSVKMSLGSGSFHADSL